MPLRPASAVWFELLTGRGQLEPALRSLAATRQVELQSHSQVAAAHLVPQLRAAIDEYRRLAQRYAEYWPTASVAPIEREREIGEIPTAALKQLRAWTAAADPFIARLQQLAHERSGLELSRRLLSESEAVLPNLELFTHAGPILATGAYLLASDQGALEIPSPVVAQRIQGSEHAWLLAVGPTQAMEDLHEALSARKAQRIELPRLPADREAARAGMAARVKEIASESGQLRSQLASLDRLHGLSTTLADLSFIEWLAEHVPELALTDHFGWITGWTSDLSGKRLEAALQRAHLHFVLRFPEAPREFARPVVLTNPRWAQPFELFGQLLGVPNASEADPSVILAFVVPLLFGFMFGDVGQGAVLVLAATILRRNYPALAILIPGGIAATGFGTLFGSVFTREDLIPALWLHPLEQPVTVLSVSLAFGATVILLGLVLDALQHVWAGQAAVWWSTRAGLVVCYLAALACVFDIRALWALPAGLAWSWIGASLSTPESAAARVSQVRPAAGSQVASGWLARLAGSVGESLETLLQLFVNTLSFVRVGAFALAHAGLAAAINGLAAGMTSRWASDLVLIAGNAAVIVIEGLIVGIQTTRLVLFEFFIRFLHGSGRRFRPLPPVPR